MGKFGQPKKSAETKDGPRRGRKADRESPTSHSAREAEDSRGELRPLEERRGALVPPPGREEKESATTGESTSVGRKKLPKSESRDSAEKGRTPDTLSAGKISLTWASTQTCQARSIPSTSILSLTGMQEQAGSSYTYGYSALLERTVL